MNGKPWLPQHTDMLRLLAHLPNALIAAHTGHSDATVQRWRTSLGLPNYYAIRYGTWRELPRPSLEAIRRAC